MQRTITVSVSPVGAATVSADGFQGQGCTSATEAIEKALAGGSGIVNRDFKEEWQAAETEQATEQQTW